MDQSNRQLVGGFTIIELGVVILLIALISLLLSPFIKIVRQKAQNIRCAHNLQKISLALREYALENDEKPPDDLAFLFTQGYIDNKKIFDCPFSQRQGTPEAPDYEYIGQFDFKLSKNIAVVFDKKDNHRDKSQHVLYLNGEIVKSGVVAE